jgi:mono/diheme cytochrome c family protein
MSEPRKRIHLEVTATQQEIARGENLFITNCALCHPAIGSGGGNLPDLGYSSEETFQNFQGIVREGLLLSQGMPDFGDRLSQEDGENIKKYILAKASKVKN